MVDSLELRVERAYARTETGLGRVRIDSASREALGVSPGDAVEIEGKKLAAARVMKAAPEDEGKGLIRMDGLTRTSAGISVDETVKIRRCETIPADKIVLAPNIPEGKKVRFGDGIEDIFRKGLMERPLLEGNEIVVPNVALMGNLSPFTVIKTVPAGVVVVTPGTRIVVKEDSSSIGAKIDGQQITYDDVGGLDEELGRVRDMIELPLKHPELFDRLGITPPKGVLLFGPPGTGKTLIAKAVAKESGASFFPIQGPEIMSKYYGESEGRLREIFEEAAKAAPSIIFLDEIDSIAPSRETASGEVERRVVAQLLTLMDGLSARGDVIVIGATNRENAVDPALRRPGRFDREIEIGIPGMSGRAEILTVHLRGMPLSQDVDQNMLASVTQGFVGADIAALAREAAMNCVSRNIDKMDLDKPIPMEILRDIKITMDDFNKALAEIEPSGMREVLVDVPKVNWNDIGGLDNVKKELREVFIPTEDTKDFEHLGITPPKGILLYGPPGTGKTLIAKAVANECGVNFISMSSADITSKWMGESEKAVKQVFKRAKQMAPCIIFFDEFDAIAPRRNAEGTHAQERVVNQLLVSMDGIENMANVTVMAATNRPDIVDPALLRPGRFDRLVLVGKPDLESRLRTLEIHTRNMPLMSVDLMDIAENTDGYVGADLAALCREAGMNAYRENPKTKYICKKHFDAAMKTVKASVSPKDMERYCSMGSEARKRRLNDDTSYV